MKKRSKESLCVCVQNIENIKLHNVNVCNGFGPVHPSSGTRARSGIASRIGFVACFLDRVFDLGWRERVDSEDDLVAGYYEYRG